MGENFPDYTYTNTFFITNTGDKELKDNWVFYFGQLPALPQNKEEAPLAAEQICSTHFKLYPTGNYRSIQPGETLAFEFLCKGAIIKEKSGPSGAYIVWLDKKGNEVGEPQNIEIAITPFERPEQWLEGGTNEPYPSGELVYDKNAAIINREYSPLYQIFPTVKQIELGDTFHKLTDNKPVYTTIINPGLGKPESYYINITEDEIEINGSDEAGLFYGIQTLRMIEENCRKEGKDLPVMELRDYPDFHYRGFMLDVCRNFTQKADVLKLLDLLASYKINKFQFHLGDDEGWRLEIPGLPELTEVGAYRGHTHDELHCLYPAYGSGWDMNDPNAAGNGYYSTADFVEILKYAAERHIQVIPEFDMPGHSRAAIKSMLARYHKYKDSDRAKAEEYLLTDLNGTSEYSSAQYYNDNAINVARPNTYNFIFKVIDEVEKLYEEAGLSMQLWNIGGDEVPQGAWEGSSYCRELAKELGADNIRDIEDYFMNKVAAYLWEKGIRMSGWQEISLTSNGKPNENLLPYQLLNHCWHNGEAGKRIPNELATAGFPVILCNVDYLYMDMPYNRHPGEPGLYWGGFVDEFKTLSMNPWDYVPVHRDKVVGLQAQLWRENIQTLAQIERALFPKLFGFIERAWNADSKLTIGAYNNNINSELYRLDKHKVNYRIAQPGIKIIDGLLHINSLVSKATIRYTTDGSDPDRNAMVWTQPIPCDATIIKAKAYFGDKESVTTVLMPSNIYSFDNK